MARNETVQPPKNQADTDPWEQFMGSEEGQDISRLFEEFRTGKKTYDEVYEEYNKKWADKPLPNTVAPSPDAPYSPIR